jgi:hypothetical protein
VPSPPAAEPPAHHPLKILIDNPWSAAKTVASLLFVVLGLLLLAVQCLTWILANSRISIPTLYGVVARSNQIVVPASAGWVAVNPDERFDDGLKLRLTVTGQVHLALHQVVALAKLGDPLTPPPPAPPRDKKQICATIPNFGRCTRLSATTSPR